MVSIEEFVDSLYKGVNGKSKEVDELKEEMKSHLIETVNELKKQGKTEEESLKIAYERFGDTSVITSGLFKIFHKQRKFIKFIFIVAITCMLIGVSSYVFMTQKDLKFHNEQKILTKGVLEIIENKNSITEDELIKIDEIIKDYKYINYFAIFKIEDISELQSKIIKNGQMGIYGNYCYPSDIKKAKIVFPNDAKQMANSPSSYDRSTVAATNGKWVVQYEYKEHIYKYIENYSKRMIFPPSEYRVPKFNYKVSDCFIVIGITLLVLWIGIKLYCRFKFHLFN